MATIFDVYIANALASLGMTDLLPIGEDPGGTEADGAINAEDFISQILTTTASYKIATSIVSNDLVVEITHLDDSDPSSTKPLWIKVDDEWLKFTSAISLTVADGTNWANLGSSEHATHDVDLFAYIVIETGASAGNKLAWSRKPNGLLVGDFSSTQDDEKYLAGLTNYNATDKAVLIGRFNATLGISGTHFWTIPATSIIVNSPISETRILQYTPQFTNLTVGDGSLVGRYQTDGVITNIDVSYIFGPSTSAITGAVSFTPPFSADYVAGTIPPLGIVIFRDTGSTQYQGSFYFSSSTAFNIRVINSTVTYARQDAISATVPHTWANTDQLLLNGQYIQL